MPAIVLVMGKKEGCNKMSKKTHFVTAPFSCNISYADYAITMVDEIEKGHHINQRISVVGA